MPSNNGFITITTQELCELLNISKGRVAQLLKEGVFVKVGRNQFHRNKSVKSYLKFKQEGLYDAKFQKFYRENKEKLEPIDETVQKLKFEIDSLRKQSVIGSLSQSIEDSSKFLEENYGLSDFKKCDGNINRTGIYASNKMSDFFSDFETALKVFPITKTKFKELKGKGVIVFDNNKDQYNLTKSVGKFAEYFAQKYQSSIPKEKEDISDARRRKEIAEASIKELELKEKSSLLVRKEEVRQELVKILGDFASKLLAVPSKAAPNLYGAEKSEIQHILSNMLRESLDELSRIDEL